MKFPRARRLQESDDHARGGALGVVGDDQRQSKQSSGASPVSKQQIATERRDQVAPAGFVESLVGSVVTGWAADPGAEHFVDRVHLSIGSLGFVVDTTIGRRDVDEGGFDDNECGFTFDLRSLSMDELVTLRGDAGSKNADLAISARSVVTNHELGVLCPSVSRILVERLIEERDNRDRFGTVGAIDGLRQGSIVGWCVFTNASETARVSLKVDGIVVCSAPCDRVRADVETMYGNPHTGFELPFPLAAFDGRPHLVEVNEIVSGYPMQAMSIVAPPLEQMHVYSGPADELRRFLKEGQDLLDRIRNSPAQSIPLASGWHELFMSEYRTSQAILERQASEQAAMAYRPKFSVICPVWNTDLSHLAEAIASVTKQSYDNWELVLADDHSSNTDVRFVLETWRVRFPDKIKVILAETNAGISGNTNRALEQASGDYVVFFDHDDIMEPDALYAFASVQQTTRYKLLYTDEDSIGTDGRLCWPHLKPSWDPILLAGLNYVCHLVCVDRLFAGDQLFLDGAFDGAQDKEFLLRLASRLDDRDVLHIPRVLYHWRHHAASRSKDSTKVDEILERSALASAQWAKSYFEAGADVTIAEPKELFGTLIRPAVARSPRLSVIIPTRDKCELLLPCISSVLACEYPDLEILVIDHESREPLSRHIFGIVERLPNCRVLPYAGSFNWSAMNNFAAREAQGDLLLFLNNDTEMLDKGALADLVGYAGDHKIGAVGAKLIYANGRIQHAGVVIGPGGIAGHGFVGLPRDDLGYFGYLRFARSVSAVTGACLMVRAEVFKAVGGFEQDTMRVGLSDVDLCLKIQALGLRNVIVSSCEVMHLESVSRGSDAEGPNATRFRQESVALRTAHSATIDADPFYNPGFEARSDPYRYLRVGPGPAYDFRQGKGIPANRQS